MTRWNASQNPLDLNAATSSAYGRRPDRFPSSPAMRGSRPRRRVVCPVTLGAILVFCIMLVLAARGIRKNDHMDLLLASGGTSRMKERRAIDADLPRKVRAQGTLWEARTVGEEDEQDSWFKSNDEGQGSDPSDSKKESEEKVENEREGWVEDVREDASATSLDGNVNEKDASLVDDTGSGRFERDDQMQQEHPESKWSSIDSAGDTLESVMTQKAVHEIPDVQAEETVQREDQERQVSAHAGDSTPKNSRNNEPVKRISFDYDDLQIATDANIDEDAGTSQIKSEDNHEDEGKTLADFYEERYEEMMSEGKNKKAERSELLRESNGDEGVETRKGTRNTEVLKAGKHHTGETDEDETAALGSVFQQSNSSVARVGTQGQAAISEDEERLTSEGNMSASDITNEDTSSQNLKNREGIHSDTIGNSSGALKVVPSNADISQTVEENEIIEPKEDTGRDAEDQLAFSRRDGIDSYKSDVDDGEALFDEDSLRDNQLNGENGAQEDYNEVRY